MAALRGGLHLSHPKHLDSPADQDKPNWAVATVSVPARSLHAGTWNRKCGGPQLPILWLYILICSSAMLQAKLPSLYINTPHPRSLREGPIGRRRSAASQTNVRCSREGGRRGRVQGDALTAGLALGRVFHAGHSPTRFQFD